MTVGMDKLNAMFRDFKVAADVGKMMEMRRFAVEYTMYGSLFWDNGKIKYIVSQQQEKITDFLHRRENFAKFPLPMITHTRRMTVPAGAEEDISRFVKIELAKMLKASYDEKFLQTFLALAQGENDQGAEKILDHLQNKCAGLYRKDNLLLFEGLLDIAYRAKHVTEDKRASYEAWLDDELHQMDNDPIWHDQFQKKLWGFAYLEQGKIKIYSNAEGPKTYARNHQLAKTGALVSAVYSKDYWYNYDITLKDVRQDFEQHLLLLFDQGYFTYLKAISILKPAIDPTAFQQLKERYSADQKAQQVLEAYQVYWGMMG